MLLIGALALSLLGNAATVGAVLRFQALRGEMLGPAAESALFPRETRRALRATLADNKARLLPQVHAVVALRAELVAEAQKRPFDRAAVAAQMAALRLASDGLLAEVQSLLLDRLEAEARN